MTKLKKGDWAVYRNDLGYIFEGGVKSPIATHFETNSVVQILDFEEESTLVYNIQRNEQFIVPTVYLENIDVFKTGKGYDVKICNRCFVLKSTEDFDMNQTDAKERKTTRPSCRECRLDIDRRLLTISEINAFKKAHRPSTGALFKCPNL